MIDSQDELFNDLKAVRQIPIVPTMLEVICQTTGMGFAAVARVTQDRWLACRVRDEVQFGLAEGEELKVETTLCNEIRDHRQPIVIDHVANDPAYKNHHTPQIYGLQSYISVPIILKDGTFFGTLCAIDANPAKVKNPKVIGTLTMFADLLSFHLQSLDLLDRSYEANIALHHENQKLANVNFDLDSFVYTASHDLKSPIANIEALLGILSDAVAREALDKDEIRQIIKLMSASLKRFAVTIKDLTAIVAVDKNSHDEIVEKINVFEIVEQVKQDLQSQITASDATIEVICADEPVLAFSRKNFKSIIYNLLSNALKYRSPDRVPAVVIKLEKVGGETRLSVSDNGLGITAGKEEKVFTMFKRFHDHIEGSGLGLYIVKRMIDNVKGRIEVNSTVNQGTTFTMIFADAGQTVSERG
ncbi:sensor histidine kinase [Pontibacter liquoris]|uniref:sensor histidine kinase n=1 Tax=Pontibacter liquoris TaxID=2905677 RepID=UPI001FA6DDDE|nr:GAF domain-containing sensor histidine kinase [Pontibacter liquoris]